MGQNQKIEIHTAHPFLTLSVCRGFHGLEKFKVSRYRSGLPVGGNGVTAMSDLTFPATAIISTLDGEEAGSDSNFLAEVLFFPEASVLAPRRPRLNLILSRRVGEILSRTPLNAIHRRRRVGEPFVQQVVLTLDPPRPRKTDDADANSLPDEAWTHPVEMRFDVVRWRHADESVIAFVPALHIEVIGADDAELDQRLPVHIRAAILRSGAGGSLRNLAELQRVTWLELRPFEVDTVIRSPKAAALEADREPPERPVIEQVGVDLTRQTLASSWELEHSVAALADNLTGRHPRSVLLVGKAGVGKTSVVYELVRRREDFQLAQTPFWATSGARLVAGMTGFGVWQQRCQRLCREASKARAVLYLGNLIELMEVGRSTHNAQGIASFLRPYIGRGEVLAITECTPEQASRSWSTRIHTRSKSSCACTWTSRRPKLATRSFCTNCSRPNRTAHHPWMMPRSIPSTPCIADTQLTQHFPRGPSGSCETCCATARQRIPRIKLRVMTCSPRLRARPVCR